MARLRFLIAVVVLAALPAGAVALDDTATDRLERATYSALPSIYRLTATIRVRSLADDRRTLRVDHTIEFEGTAFGVGPDAVVTARHLVRPSTEQLLLSLRDLGIEAVRDFDPNNVRITSRLVSIVLDRAQPTSAGVGPDRLRVTVAAVSDAASPADLALLATPRTAQPALPLDDATTGDTPIAVIGFGSQARTPALRPGRIALAARVEGSSDENLVTLNDVDAQRGDSGGPVIDRNGGVHGVLIRRAVASGDLAVMTRAAAIRALAGGTGLAIETTPAQSDFAAGMRAFWARDYTLAADAVERVAQRLPRSVWITDEAARLRALAEARYGVVQTTPWRVPLLLIGLAALAAATLLAVRFWTMEEDR